MSFVSGFYSFHVDLSHSERDVYQTVRVKTARHPQESAVHLMARVCAWLHSYEKDLEFSEGLYQPKQPAIWKRDVVGNLTNIIEVGVGDTDKLRKDLKQAGQARLRVYFYEPAQLERFCHGMRGSTTNWLAEVEFFQFQTTDLENLAQHLSSSMRWSLTISDHEFFLSWEDRYFEFKLSELDIWNEYQLSLENGSLGKVRAG